MTGPTPTYRESPIDPRTLGWLNRGQLAQDLGLTGERITQMMYQANPRHPRNLRLRAATVTYKGRRYTDPDWHTYDPYPDTIRNSEHPQ